MSKGPIFAISASIIALISIYLFLDIKQSKEVESPTEVQTTSLSDVTFIDDFNSGLDPNTQADIQRWYSLAKEQKSKEAVDSLILKYEELQQYNLAAYFHSLKAELEPSLANWELAGDRQFSVSANEAYDPGFNQILYENAIASYSKALNLDSTDLDLKVKLGSAIVEKAEQPMQGISLLLEVIAADSMHLAANLALGKFGIISGQYDKAILRIEKVLSLQPENTEALFLAAEAESNLGNKEAAKVYLEKCKALIENEELKTEIDAYIKQLME
ncbi:MAG: tetratricopeptide repeat protein [Chitinophagales bacterium]|nr:tetratricopeptide repeat protein [Chitinophagales bacterium]